MNSDIQERLAEPFEPDEVEWKPQAVKGNRCLAVAYIDARCVMDRLDEAVGNGNWKDHYEVLNNGSVKCTLSVKYGDEWIEKSDVGSMSDQPDEGDRLKSAFSDALKRTAVKVGVGRYLYRLPPSWVDFDPNTRKILATPKLPEWALPKPKIDQDIRRKGLALLIVAAQKGGEAFALAFKTLSQDMRAACQTDKDAMMATVKQWKDWLESEPNQETVQKHAPEIKYLNDLERAAVWKVVSDYAAKHNFKLEVQ